MLSTILLAIAFALTLIASIWPAPVSVPPGQPSPGLMLTWPHPGWLGLSLFILAHLIGRT